MLTVSENAKKKFKETLEMHTKDPEAIIRITASADKPNKLEFVLDREKEGDQVIQTEDEKKILVVENDLADKLEGMVLDYDEKPDGAGFAIFKKS